MPVLEVRERDLQLPNAVAILSGHPHGTNGGNVSFEGEF